MQALHTIWGGVEKRSQYEAIVNKLQFPTSCDRNLINQEISSLIKCKRMSNEQARSICQEMLSLNSRDKLNDKQLGVVSVRDELAFESIDKSLKI